MLTIKDLSIIGARCSLDTPRQDVEVVQVRNYHYLATS